MNVWKTELNVRVTSVKVKKKFLNQELVPVYSKMLFGNKKESGTSKRHRWMNPKKITLS